MKYMEYANHMGANPEVINWVRTTLQSHLKDHDPTQTEVEHLLDYACSADGPTKMVRMSYAQLKSLSDKWSKAQQKRGENIKETVEDTKTIHEFDDGSRIAELLGRRAYEREGFLMRHCCLSFYGKAGNRIFSLRDKNNNPHVTFDVSSDGDDIHQLKGKGNGSIHPKYIHHVLAFLEKMKIKVRSSEMVNLGYYELDDELEGLITKVCGGITKAQIGGVNYVFAGT